MRTLLVLALCVALLTAVGIIHFRKTGDKVNVSIDTGELRDKTEELIDAVKDTLSHNEDGDNGDTVEDRARDRLEEFQGAFDSAEEAGEEFLDHTRRAIRELKR